VIRESGVTIIELELELELEDTRMLSKDALETKDSLGWGGR